MPPCIRSVPRTAIVAASLALATLSPAAARAQRGDAPRPAACARGTSTDSAAAQAPGPRLRSDSGATIRIIAAVHADELRFAGSPTVCVRLHGDAQLDSVRVTARRNIASPVVSNTTYRDVYVAVEIIGRLNADCLAARITGAAPDSAATGRCATLGVQSRP